MAPDLTKKVDMDQNVYQRQIRLLIMPKEENIS